MAASPTVLVVGGGVTGVGLARDLALRGVDVTLVERGGLGSGASGCSHGVLHSGARYAESDPAGAAECLEENRVLRRTAGACVRETGGLFVGLEIDSTAYFNEKQAACEAVGIDTTTLDDDQARDRVPGLSETVEQAFRVPDGVVYPSRLVAANAAAAEAQGATVCPHTPLTGLTVADGRITTVELGGGSGPSTTRLAPEFIVNAAGAWAGSIASMAGVNLPMAPTRGVMVSVDYPTLGSVLNRCRSPADGDIIVPHESEAVAGTTSVSVSDPDEHAQADWEIDRSLDQCAAMLPPIADAEIVRTWWGVRPLYDPDSADTERRDISRGFACLDHEADDVSNFVSVVGGKLTTYRRMAEATADLVCDRLGVRATCVTATRSLPHADDPARLDEYVDRYDSQGPTDTNVRSPPA
jgi:Glycerol-3-phosphate dehydrogenase